MNDIKLKPCPCCGGKAKLCKCDGFGGSGVYVECVDKECNMQTDIVRANIDYCAKEKVAEIWNRRPR